MDSKSLISQLETRLNYCDSLTDFVQQAHRLLTGYGVAITADGNVMLDLVDRIRLLGVSRDSCYGRIDFLSGNSQEAHRILTGEFGLVQAGAGTVPERLRELLKKWQSMQASLASLKTSTQKPAEEPTPDEPVYSVFFREEPDYGWLLYRNLNTEQYKWDNYYRASDAAWQLVKAGVCYEAQVVDENEEVLQTWRWANGNPTAIKEI